MSRTVAEIRVSPSLFGDDGRFLEPDSTKVRRKAATPAIARPRKKIAFGWYCGKFNHLDWLLPLLPQCQHYCEPFGGSAAVLLNRVPSPVETYNDLDGEVVNFFSVLRTERQELIESIGLTPFSREEFFVACQPRQASISNLERARRFFVRARQVRTGLAQTASLGRWANCKETSRRGMSGVVSRWLGSVESLPDARAIQANAPVAHRQQWRDLLAAI